MKNRILSHRVDRAADGDRGMSLVELMVTMLITGIVAAMTATLVIGVQQTNEENTVRQNQIDAARVAVEGMSKTLRTSVKPSQFAICPTTSCTQDAFLVGSRTAVQFYANINNPGNSIGPSQVTYTVATSGPTSGDLVETIQKPNSPVPSTTGYVYCTTGAGCASNKKTRVLARDVVTTAGPVFRYFDDAGVEMVPPSTGSLSSAQLKKVLSIEIVVRVQSGTGSDAHPTTYIQRVLLPNSQSVLKAGTP